VRLASAWALLALLALLGACDATEGDVLSSFEDTGPTTSTTSGDGDSSGGDGDGTSGDGDGDGDGDACAVEGPCPLPGAGQVTVCGRVYDLADTSPLGGEPGQGAENLAVRVFDLLSFSGDPTAEPLATVQPDECGWYVAENIEGLPPGPIVVSTNDRSFPGLTFQPLHSVHNTTLGQIVRANAWILRIQTDAGWASDAGLGGTFASIGSMLAIYIDVNQPPTGPFQGRPVAGVAMTSGGDAAPANDYYFADTAVLDRASVDPGLTVTGANGVGLLRDLDIANVYGGTRDGCEFDTVTGLTAPGVIQVHEFNGTCDP